MIDRVQSQVAEHAQKIDVPAPTGQEAARFEQLLDGSSHSAGTPTGAEASRTHLAEQPDRVGGAGSVGDRILANMGSGSVQPSGTAEARAVDPVRGGTEIAIGDPVQAIEAQMRVAELRAETGLAAAAVQKTSQGMDTLLKSQ